MRYMDLLPKLLKKKVGTNLGASSSAGKIANRI